MQSVVNSDSEVRWRFRVVRVFRGQDGLEAWRGSACRQTYGGGAVTGSSITMRTETEARSS